MGAANAETMRSVRPSTAKTLPRRTNTGKDGGTATLATDGGDPNAWSRTWSPDVGAGKSTAAAEGTRERAPGCADAATGAACTCNGRTARVKCFMMWLESAEVT